jgi:hypothetical protein
VVVVVVVVVVAVDIPNYMAFQVEALQMVSQSVFRDR